MRTQQERIAIAKEWHQARQRGITQARFASSLGIGERTLRSYVSEHAPTAPPADQLRDVLLELQTTVVKLLERLDNQPNATAEEGHPHSASQQDDRQEAASRKPPRPPDLRPIVKVPVVAPSTPKPRPKLQAIQPPGEPVVIEVPKTRFSWDE